jgi:phosphatidylinositol-3-phosphatase
MEPGQRYCFHCGARRGQLSSRVAGTIGALYERGRPPIVTEPEPEPERAAEPPPSRLDWRTPLGPRMPTPRAASMAVMAMLGFGVILGSLGHVSVQTLASAPSLILNLPTGGSSSSSAPSGGGSGGGSGSGGSGGTQVQTVTVGGGTVPGSSALSGGGGASSSSTGANNGPGTPTGFHGLPAIQHVFLIVLSQQGYNQTFSPTGSDSYLNKTLAGEGELFPFYYSVAPSSLANEIALLSGQGPTQQTAANCPSYNALVATGNGYNGQVLGDGCVYPASTKTLLEQLTADHKTWRAYIGGMSGSCSHPGLGSADPVPSSTSKPYAAWTNPIIFFQSLSGSKGCHKDDVALGQLNKDLKTESNTPSFSYIAPSPCDDGSDQPCGPGAPSGLGPADKFLRSTVAEIKRSPAYRSGGLIAITFDEAPQSGANPDSSSCCGNPVYPNVPATTTTTTPTATDTTTTATTTPTATDTTTTATTTPTASGQTSPTGGGGQVGLLLISKWVTPNQLDVFDYFNHFSLLAGIENLFGLKHLGYAAVPGLPIWTTSQFRGPGP